MPFMGEGAVRRGEVLTRNTASETGASTGEMARAKAADVSAAAEAASATEPADVSATKPAAYMSAAEAATYMSAAPEPTAVSTAEAATSAVGTAAASSACKCVSGQSGAESRSGRQNNHGLTYITLTPSNAVRVRSIKDHPLRPRGSLRPKSYCDVQLFQVDVQYAAGDKRKTAQIDAIKVDSYG